MKNDGTISGMCGLLLLPKVEGGFYFFSAEDVLQASGPYDTDEKRVHAQKQHNEFLQTGVIPESYTVKEFGVNPFL